MVKCLNVYTYAVTQQSTFEIFQRPQTSLPIEFDRVKRLSFTLGRRLVQPFRREILRSLTTILCSFAFGFQDSRHSTFNEHGEKTVLVFIVAHNSHSSTHNVEERNAH